MPGTVLGARNIEPKGIWLLLLKHSEERHQGAGEIKAKKIWHGFDWAQKGSSVFSLSTFGNEFPFIECGFY